MNLYFVKATDGFNCVFAGHWLAETPKAAITIGQGEMERTATSGFAIGKHTLRAASCTWSARKSKADPAAMALNK